MSGPLLSPATESMDPSKTSAGGAIRRQPSRMSLARTVGRENSAYTTAIAPELPEDMQVNYEPRSSWNSPFKGELEKFSDDKIHAIRIVWKEDTSKIRNIYDRLRSVDSVLDSQRRVLILTPDAVIVCSMSGPIKRVIPLGSIEMLYTQEMNPRPRAVTKQTRVIQPGSRVFVKGLAKDLESLNDKAAVVVERAVTEGMFKRAMKKAIKETGHAPGTKWKVRLDFRMGRAKALELILPDSNLVVDEEAEDDQPEEKMDLSVKCLFKIPTERDLLVTFRRHEENPKSQSNMHFIQVLEKVWSQWQWKRVHVDKTDKSYRRLSHKRLSSRGTLSSSRLRPHMRVQLRPYCYRDTEASREKYWGTVVGLETYDEPDPEQNKTTRIKRVRVNWHNPNDDELPGPPLEAISNRQSKISFAEVKEGMLVEMEPKGCGGARLRGKVQEVYRVLGQPDAMRIRWDDDWKRRLKRHLDQTHSFKEYEPPPQIDRQGREHCEKAGNIHVLSTVPLDKFQPDWWWDGEGMANPVLDGLEDHHGDSVVHIGHYAQLTDHSHQEGSKGCVLCSIKDKEIQQGVAMRQELQYFVEHFKDSSGRVPNLEREMEGLRKDLVRVSNEREMYKTMADQLYECVVKLEAESEQWKEQCKKIAAGVSYTKGGLTAEDLKTLTNVSALAMLRWDKENLQNRVDELQRELDRAEQRLIRGGSRPALERKSSGISTGSDDDKKSLDSSFLGV